MFDLLNEISELVYISDPETYDLLYMNAAGLKSFGLESVEGLKCYRALQGLDSPCEFCTNAHLNSTDFYTWERFNPVTGRHYVLEDKLVDFQGRLARMEIAFDLTEENRQKQGLQSALKGQNAVLECVKLLHSVQNLDYALDMILEKIGRFWDADRAYIFEIENNAMSNTHEWCAPAVTPQIALLQNLPVPADSRELSLLVDDACLTLDNLDRLQQKHPDAFADFKAQGIERLAAVPLELEGQLQGYLGVDNPRIEPLENLSALLRTLAYFLCSSLRRQNDKRMLETLSYYDTLTGALNRNAFIRDLEAFMALPESVGIVCIDINGMKEINDTHGQHYGDKILVRAAETLTALFGPGSLYRSGGDEFVVISRSITEADLEARVRELRNLLSTRVECRASIGYRWAEECSALQRILFEADEYMYADKKQYYYGQPGSRYRHNNDDILGLTMPGALERMLGEGRFLVYFQPKVSVYSGSQIGSEALIRLRTPDGAIVAPDQFIPVLEQARLIDQIDFFVFDRVCTYLSRWIKQGLPVVPVSVNFSRYTITGKHFQSRLREIWEKHKIPQDLLEIEVTESAEADDNYNFIRVIEETRASGFSVSIDDFGVKYANLSLFTSVDFDVLKIDRSLVMELPSNFKARAIIQSVADICRKMDIRLIAEGVETQDQLSTLQELDCGGAQGYLFSRPLPRKEYEEKYLRALEGAANVTG